MIAYEHFKLDNGLEVYLHKDNKTPMAAFNILYNVGSRDENPEKTGFAHLFEHLMFGGSKNIPSYDEPLQRVGGDNNAFTSPDITNYYITLPAANIETAFWLESDRMLSLSFDPEVLEVQRKVVIEEFKQRYLNQPYGDIWLKLRPLAYKKHPYQWATIGKDISHIKEASMEDVKEFFFKYYRPNNAILVVAGNFELEQIKNLSQKWFGEIPAGPIAEKKIAKEPLQTSARLLETEAEVPLSSIYKAYKMPGKYEEGYYTADLLSDVLGNGKSSRLYTELVKKDKLFNSISAYVTGSLDTGLLVISGKVNTSVDINEGDKAIESLLSVFVTSGSNEQELNKVKSKAEASIRFSEVELLNRAMNIAFAANGGNPEYCNQASQKIAAIDTSELQSMSHKLLQPTACSTLLYKAKN